MIRAVEDELEEKGVMLSHAQGHEDSGEEVSDGRAQLLQRLRKTCQPETGKAMQVLFITEMYFTAW